MIEQIITSSILIVSILIISFLMEKRVNPCLKYALWLFVVIKLLIPLPEFQSNISVMNLANQINGNDVRYQFVDNKITLDDTVIKNPIDEKQNPISNRQDLISEKQNPNDEVQNVDNMMSKESILYEQAEADQVCIRVEPSVLRDNPFYYYIPAGEEQEWLINRVKSLDLNGEPFDRRWEEKKETGWRILYNNMEFMVFEGGYLYYTYDSGSGIMECLICPNFAINGVYYDYRPTSVWDNKEFFECFDEIP